MNSLSRYLFGAALSVALSASAYSATIIDTAKSAGTLSSFLETLKEVGLEQQLNETGPYTVFAPSDEAFAKMPARVREGLKYDKDWARKVMAMHIVQGKVLIENGQNKDHIKTLAGPELSVKKEKREWSVEGVPILEPDVEVDNGVIHVIDAVLLPQ
ncbi:fasciclin domain-containing protein [Pigmentiphaga soli]|uniref:Fasciclin domain-containing protein n=1 Tax=Pigmentiphaga soli TaxID=1007095 RepID=A0ABP8H2A7_9BURK